MFKFCFHYLKKHKLKLIIYLILTFLISVLSIMIPLITGEIIDTITQFNNFSLLLYLCIIFALIQIINITISFITNREYITIQANTAYLINLMLIERLQKMPISKTALMESGYLSQQINGDSNAITSFVINLMSELLTNLAIMMFSIYVLIRLNNILGIVLSVLSIIYILIYVLLKNKIYIMSSVLKEQQASFFSDMLLQLRDIKFVKLHSLFSKFIDKLNTAFKIYLKNVIKSQMFFYTYSSLESIITTAANIFVFLIGGINVMKNNITIGEFTIIISFFGFILNSFKYFSNLGKNYQDNLVSYSRIEKILNEKEQINGEKMISSINSISCENLCFSHEKKKVLNNFNCNFVKGKSYCIFGKNGAGKTTLIDLIVGIYVGEFKGKIKYNSIEINDIDVIDLRLRKISILEQNVLIFEGSVDENIFLTEEQNETNIIRNTPDQIFFENISRIKEIHSDKSGVSGGEAQKIALMRMLAKDADLYILDEPSSALDKESKKRLIECINFLKKNKILIVISHDKELIDECDCALNIEYLEENI